MFYRESGEFHTTYGSEQRLFRLSQERFALILFLIVAWIAVPLLATEYWLSAILIPFLTLSLAALGLNVLTGYTGQISLGTGGFMAVGAYSCYKLITIFPDLPIVIAVLLSGVFSGIAGVIFGLPSLRIKGFYLAVTTLAAQFFFEWLFGRVSWFYNDNISGAIEVPSLTMLGVYLTGPVADPIVRYLVVLGFVCFFALILANVLRSRIGRGWQAVRDHDIAAEIIGINLLRAKLSAFAVSSYVCGVAGAMLIFFHYGAAEVQTFDISLSFRVLFMVIIGGLGSLAGSFLGAAFLTTLPIFITNLPRLLGLEVPPETVEHLSLMIIGGLIVALLIIEPHGLARLWQLLREKLRLWPFPH